MNRFEHAQKPLRSPRALRANPCGRAAAAGAVAAASLLLVAGAVGSLASCGADDGSAEAASAEAASADEARLGERLPPADPAVPERAAQPAPVLGSSAEGENAAGDFIGETAPAALSPDQACAARAVEAEAIERVVEVPVEREVIVPSVFYVMLDSSGSMVQDPFSLASVIEQILDLFGLGQSPPPPTKWDFALAGMKDFVQDPSSAGLELALGFFPGGGACDGSGYDIPSVALGPLPGNAAAIEAALDARVPTGGTPLEGALRGVTDFCLAYNAEHPDASCVAVLITDGAAEECSARSATALGNIARSAADRGVITYAAGMEGADFAVLDAIGAAGGTDCNLAGAGFACDLTADDSAFTDALNGIRDRTRTQTRIETRIERGVQAIPCSWEIPPPPAGESFDPARVNVELSLPAAAPLSIGNVPSAADCGAGGGWFYEDASTPTALSACPSTCEQLSANPEARVELLFGCATVLR